MRRQGVSVVVPFFNEEETITLFCKTIDEYVEKINFPIEIVFVNDGSQDDSISLLKEYEFANIKEAVIVDFSRNFGSHAAVRAGILNSRYDICTWIGMDLQEPLDIIRIAYEGIAEKGYEAVYFEKKTIKVSKANRFFSKVYSFLMKKYAVKTYSSDGTATIAIGGKLKDYLNNNVEANSSIILQIMNAGFNYETVALDYNERLAGVSKWTLSKKIKLFIDSFVSFSFMPIRLVSIVGIFIFFIGLLIGILSFVNKIINPYVPLGYSTIACILALGFGVTNISLGIIAEYLWRTYDAAMRRPVFVVSEVYDLFSAKTE